MSDERSFEDLAETILIGEASGLDMSQELLLLAAKANVVYESPTDEEET